MRPLPFPLFALPILSGLIVACSSPPEVAQTQAPQTQAPRTQAPSTAPSASSPANGQLYPDVLDARLSPTGSDQFNIAVTISSPYDTPERYADGWRVLTPEGEILAEHELAHDHASEQPFTRSRGPFSIPDEVTEVIVEGRDLANGYGGGTITIAVP